MSLAGFLSDLERLDRFGRALDRVAERRRNPDIIDLEEVRPGVFAAPRPRRQSRVARVRSLWDEVAEELKR